MEVNKVMSQQVSTEIKCTDCGKAARVPFKPTAGKPVYCRECLAKHRSTGSGNRGETKRSSEGSEKQAWFSVRRNWK
jgi:CxxC-x17-CxxC domain-containing protein